MTSEKHYGNQEITIIWKPDLCIHAANCRKGLPEVFKPAEKPWVHPEKASSSQIIDQVAKCPSGALSYFINTKP